MEIQRRLLSLGLSHDSLIFHLQIEIPSLHGAPEEKDNRLSLHDDNDPPSKVHKEMHYFYSVQALEVVL